MSDKSLLETLTDAIVDAANDALDGVNPNLPKLTAPDPALARADLAELVTKAAAITAAGDPAAWVGALIDWRATLSHLATHAFGPQPGADDAMIVRLLQERMPRTAALLMLTGVISSPPQGKATIDWVKLKALITDPGTLVNEDLWSSLLGDAGIPGNGRLAAVLAGLVLMFPQAILALAHGDLSVLPLASPPAAGPGPWQDFRDATADWVSITVPFPDPARPEAERSPAGMFDLVADLDPNLSATIGFRSDRRVVGVDSRTDFEMWLALAVDGDRWQYDLGDAWFVRVEPGISAGFGYDGEWHGAFRPFDLASLAHPPGPSDPVVATLGRELAAGAPDVSIGPPYDTRLIIEDLGLFLKVRESHPIVEIGGFAHGFSVVLTNRWWRTFGATSTLFGEGIRFDLDLDLAWIEGRGVVLNLGAGLDVTFNVEWTPLGDRNPSKGSFDLTIHSIRLVVPVLATQDSFNIRAEIRFHASLRIGPVVIVVDGPGGWVGYWTEGNPPAKHYVGGLLPTGAGLELTLPVVTGGGFLDFTGGPNQRFGGLVHLKLSMVEVIAFGLHELTGREGDAVRKTSLVMVIGIRFTPGIQLGYGFAITGFGGLVGINRRADTDALRERLTSGAAGNVLFAEDPVRNAPTILGDLAALFPPADGVFVFGPTIQLSWLKISGSGFAKLDVGIFIELPGPNKIVLMGSLRAQIPGTEVILFLRLDFVGLVDFQKKVIEFDATLISSHVLGIFIITGDAAFRASYGDRPYVMLSLGGFHPDFVPEPAVFPEMTRIALTLKMQNSILFMRGESYFAVTTNSFQFGGGLELGIHAGPLNAIGFIRLDALITFTPFHFEVAISAGFSIRWNAHHAGRGEDRGNAHGARTGRHQRKLLHRAAVLRHLLERLVLHRRQLRAARDPGRQHGAGPPGRAQRADEPGGGRRRRRRGRAAPPAGAQAADLAAGSPVLDPAAGAVEPADRPLRGTAAGGQAVPHLDGVRSPRRGDGLVQPGDVRDPHRRRAAQPPILRAARRRHPVRLDGRRGEPDVPCPHDHGDPAAGAAARAAVGPAARVPARDAGRGPLAVRPGCRAHDGG